MAVCCVVFAIKVVCVGHAHILDLIPAQMWRDLFEEFPFWKKIKKKKLNPNSFLFM